LNGGLVTGEFSGINHGGYGGLVLQKSSIISPDNGVFVLIAIGQRRRC
jgi:hypothetical protein